LTVNAVNQPQSAPWLCWRASVAFVFFFDNFDIIDTEISEPEQREG